MKEYESHLKDIAEIKDLMSQSAKFMSLSGLAGVSAGIVAIAGVIVASILEPALVVWEVPQLPTKAHYAPANLELITIGKILGIGLAVMILAIGTSSLFSMRMAKKRGLPVWNKTGRHMLINLIIPIGAGGFFCLMQIHMGFVHWLAATMLLFYGMALLNASKYTLREIKFLGLFEIILGLLAAYFVNAGIIFWTIGFGVLHIFYGILMYLKYER